MPAWDCHLTVERSRTQRVPHQFEDDMRDIPAFPTSADVCAMTQGMTLRDYFAAKAMQGMFSNYEYTEFDDDETALLAYQAADAMLKAR